MGELLNAVKLRGRIHKQKASATDFSDGKLEETIADALLFLRVYSGAFMLSTMLIWRTWRRMRRQTTNVNSMVSAMLNR